MFTHRTNLPLVQYNVYSFRQVRSSIQLNKYTVENISILKYHRPLYNKTTTQQYLLDLTSCFIDITAYFVSRDSLIIHSTSGNYEFQRKYFTLKIEFQYLLASTLDR